MFDLSKIIWWVISHDLLFFMHHCTFETHPCNPLISPTVLWVLLQAQFSHIVLLSEDRLVWYFPRVHLNQGYSPHINWHINDLSSYLTFVLESCAQRGQVLFSFPSPGWSGWLFTPKPTHPFLAIVLSESIALFMPSPQSCELKDCTWVKAHTLHPAYQYHIWFPEYHQGHFWIQSQE